MPLPGWAGFGSPPGPEAERLIGQVMDAVLAALKAARAHRQSDTDDYYSAKILYHTIATQCWPILTSTDDEKWDYWDQHRRRYLKSRGLKPPPDYD